MMPAVDALFVGNAIMDVFGTCDDTFLTAHDIEKGSMTLVDEARALTLYKAMSGAQNSQVVLPLIVRLALPCSVERQPFQEN